MCTTLFLLYMTLVGSRAASVHERSAQLPDLVAKGPVVPALVAPGRHTVLTGLAQTPVMNVDTIETRVPGKIVTVVKQAKAPVMQTGAATFQTRQADFGPTQSPMTSQVISQRSPISFSTGYLNSPQRTVTTQTLVPQSGQVLVEALPPKPLPRDQVPNAVFQQTGEFQSGMLTATSPTFGNMQRFTAQEGVSVGPAIPPRQQVQFQTGMPVTVRPAMSAKLMATEETYRRPTMVNRRPAYENQQNVQYQSGYIQSVPTVTTQTVAVPTQVSMQAPVLPPRQMVQVQTALPVNALPVGPVETPAPSPQPQPVVTQQVSMTPPIRNEGYTEVREVVQPAPVVAVSPPQPVPISVRTSQVTPPITTTRQEVSIGSKNVLTETVMPHLVEGRRPAVMNNRPYDTMVASTARPVISGPVSPKQRVTVTHSEQPLYYAPPPPVLQVAPSPAVTVTQVQPVNPIPVVEQAVPVPTTYTVPVVSAPPVTRHRITTTQVKTEAMAPPLPVISTLPPVPATPVALEKVVAPLPQPVAPTRVVTTETISAPVPTVALPPPSVTVKVKGPPPQPIVMQSPPPRVVKIQPVLMKHVPPPMVTPPPPPPRVLVTTLPPPPPVMVTSPPPPVMVTIPPPPVFTSLPPPTGPTRIPAMSTSRHPPTHIHATIVPPPIGSVITTVEPSVTTVRPHGTVTYEAGWKEYEVTSTPKTDHGSYSTSENVVQVDRKTDEETLPHHMELAADQPYQEEEREEQENNSRILQQPKPEKLIAHDMTHDADKDTETVDVNVMGQTPKPETQTVTSEQSLPKNKTIIWNLSIAPVPERVSLTVRRGNEKIYDAEYNKAGQFVKVDGEKQAVEKCFWYYTSDTMASNKAKEPEDLLPDFAARLQPGTNTLPMRYTSGETRPSRRKNGHPRVRVIEQIQMPPPAQADMFARSEDFFPEGPQSKKPTLPVKSLETATGIKAAEGSGMKHVGKVPSEGHIFWTPDQSRRGHHMVQPGSGHHDHVMETVSGDQVPHVRLPVYFSNVQRKRKSD